MNGLIKKGLSEEERVKLLVDYWKQSTSVLQHFNDISMKVRNFAIVIYSGFLTAVALSLHKGVFISIFSYEVSAAFMFAIAGAVTTQLIHFMDTHWYHRMLKASVGTTLGIESQIQKALKIPKLSDEISKASQDVYLLKFLGCLTLPISPKPLLQKLPIFSQVKTDSTYRHIVFYRWLIAIILIIGFLSIFSRPNESGIIVKNDGTPEINQYIHINSENISESYSEVGKCFLNKLIDKNRVNNLFNQVSHIDFAHNEALINLEYKDNKRKIHKIIDIILKNSEYSYLIEGATSSVGELEYNSDLGFRRAESLKSSLIMLGIKEELLFLTSVGEQQITPSLKSSSRSVSIHAHKFKSECIV